MNGHSDTVVPLPALHVVGERPRSIAVPLKMHSIFAVNSKESKDVLVSYYVTAVKCLSLNKYKSKQDIFSFNSAFCEWLEKEVHYLYYVIYYI